MCCCKYYWLLLWLCEFHVDNNRAFLRVFNRISNNRHENRLDSIAICADYVRNTRVEIDFEVKWLILDLQAEEIDEFIAKFADWEACRIKHEGILKNHVVVKDVVDKELNESRIVFYWFENRFAGGFRHDWASEFRKVVDAVKCCPEFMRNRLEGVDE